MEIRKYTDEKFLHQPYFTNSVQALSTSSSSLECSKAQKETTIEKVSSTLDEATITLSLFDIGNQQSFFQTSGSSGYYDDGLALFHHFAAQQLMHRFFN